MHKFSGVSYETSDQHKDVSAAKQARDISDTVDLIDYLNERDSRSFLMTHCLTSPMAWQLNKESKINWRVHILES